MTGQDIKKLIRKKRLRQYEVAQELRINEFTLSRWLRGELDEEKEQKLIQAINAVAERVSEDDE